MGCEGLEQYPQSAAILGIPTSGGAESGAVDADSDPIDADLAAVVRAWPTMPEQVRRAILALTEVPEV
jgi:hypothetical protein